MLCPEQRILSFSSPFIFRFRPVQTVAPFPHRNRKQTSTETETLALVLGRVRFPRGLGHFLGSGVVVSALRVAQPGAIHLDDEPHHRREADQTGLRPYLHVILVRRVYKGFV